MDDKLQNDFFTRLAAIYDNMDKSWNAAASAYEFKCTGCSENCCETEFYHYTCIEKDYLLRGMDTLDQYTKKQVLSRAEKVNRCRAIAEKTGKRIRIMCPLNMDSLCIIYKFRPMMCRLHGIPHELCTPCSGPVMNPGCDIGTFLFKAKGYIKFDRTPFYKKMADIEMEYRKATGESKKIKQTIAQMICMEVS